MQTHFLLKIFIILTWIVSIQKFKNIKSSIKIFSESSQYSINFFIGGEQSISEQEWTTYH